MRLQGGLDALAVWCAAAGLTPVPAEPATIGATLVSLKDSHAPTTMCRRLSAIGKMHRFNDLPWNPAHCDIQGPLQGFHRPQGVVGKPQAAGRDCGQAEIYNKVSITQRTMD